MVATVLSANESSFANESNNGFSARIGGSEARRQLRMSVGVVVMLSIGIVSAAVTVGSHPIAAKRDLVSTAPVTMMHAESNVVGAKPI